jgi:hypothetical protein
MIHIDGRDMDYSKPLHANLHKGSLKDALKTVFQGYNLTEQLKRLTKDNTERNYQAHLKKNGCVFNIDYLT